MTVKECIKKHGKTTTTLDLEEYPFPWEGTNTTPEEYIELYDGMRKMVDEDYFSDDEVFDDPYIEQCSWEPDECCEETLKQNMNNQGYKYWIYG